MLNTTSRYEESHPIQVALVSDDDTQFGKEVPLTIGMKTEDTIFEAVKGGEIEMFDNIWKRVKNNHSPN